MPISFYPAVVDQSPSGTFGVSFPDFPGCVAAGDTVNEAAVQAQLALAFHVDGMLQDGERLPKPSQLDAIEPVEGAVDVARFLVRIERPVKVSRVLVSLDQDLLEAVDAVASNRSAFLADAARAALLRRAQLVAPN